MSGACSMISVLVAALAAAMMVEPTEAFVGGVVGMLRVPWQARPALFSPVGGCGRVRSEGPTVMLAKGGKPKKKPGTVAENRQARFNYQIDEKFECGIVLVGTEVKSCRDGKCNIRKCICKPQNWTFCFFK